MIIERLGSEIVFVELVCPQEVIETRIDNPDRRALGKLASLPDYRRLRDQGAFEFRQMPTPVVKIDTSQCSSTEAAQRIVALLDIYELPRQEKARDAGFFKTPTNVPIRWCRSAEPRGGPHHRSCPAAVPNTISACRKRPSSCL